MDVIATGMGVGTVKPTFDLNSLTPSLPKTGKITPGSAPGDDSPTGKLANSFADSLANKLGEVEDTQRDAQQKMRLFAAGKIDNVHEVTVAMQKANLAMRTATLVREKLIGGFDQLKRMQ